MTSTSEAPSLPGLTPSTPRIGGAGSATALGAVDFFGPGAIAAMVGKRSAVSGGLVRESLRVGGGAPMGSPEMPPSGRPQVSIPSHGGLAGLASSDREAPERHEDGSMQVTPAGGAKSPTTEIAWRVSQMSVRGYDEGDSGEAHSASVRSSMDRTDRGRDGQGAGGFEFVAPRIEVAPMSMGSESVTSGRSGMGTVHDEVLDALGRHDGRGAPGSRRSGSDMHSNVSMGLEPTRANRGGMPPRSPTSTSTGTGQGSTRSMGGRSPAASHPAGVGAGSKDSRHDATAGDREHGLRVASRASGGAARLHRRERSAEAVPLFRSAAGSVGRSGSIDTPGSGGGKGAGARGSAGLL